MLSGPENLRLWKAEVIEELESSKVYGVITAGSGAPVVGTGGATASDLREWIGRDEKAHGIIQERLSDGLLLQTEWCGSARGLWEELHKVVEGHGGSSGFYVFQELCRTRWDGRSRASEHIGRLRRMEGRLAGTKLTLDGKMMGFILLNSLPKSGEWESFKGRVTHWREDGKISFEEVEREMIGEERRLDLSGQSEGGKMGWGGGKGIIGGEERTTWCEHHLSGTHDSGECKAYKKWARELRQARK